MQMGQLNNFVLVMNDDGTFSIDGAWLNTNSIPVNRLVDASAVSVLARSANSSGPRADLAAAANGQVLARVNNALVWVADTKLPIIDPLTLSPYLYYDADMDDPTYNDNDAVGSATDQSGNGRHATQATGTKKPTFKTNILNGRAIYRFDGGDCLQVSSVALTTFTVVVVLKGNPAGGMIYEHGPNADANNGSALYGAVNNSMLCAKGGVRSSRNIVANWDAVSHWRIGIQQYDGLGTHSRFRFYCDGTWIVCGNGNNGANDPGIGSVTDTLNWGARNNAASLGYNGDMATFGIFTPALTSAQVIGIYNYFCDRYNL